MAQTDQIQIRVSTDDKEQAKELFNRYGLTTSAAIKLFIRRSLKENRLPFNFDETEPPVRSEGQRRVQNTL